MKSLLTKLAALLLLMAAPLAAAAGDEVYAPASPNKPWPLDFPGQQRSPEEASWVRPVLLWLPNRFLDLADVLRFDAGAGPAYGGVLRISRYGQGGYRRLAPWSLRAGARGRRWPLMIERSAEEGIGPWYSASPQRKVCPGELGAGLDLGLAGAYLGICLDALPDLLAGLFFADTDRDDLR